jgi:hypothetical protein
LCPLVQGCDAWTVLCHLQLLLLLLWGDEGAAEWDADARVLGLCGPVGLDPVASWDVALSKVASSGLTERDLCCTIWAWSNLHRNQLTSGHQGVIAKIRYKSTLEDTMPKHCSPRASEKPTTKEPRIRRNTKVMAEKTWCPSCIWPLVIFRQAPRVERPLVQVGI